VIVAVNRRATPTIAALRAAGRPTDRIIVLLVIRHGAALYMSLSR
jgi:hypothetical protein